MAFLNSVTVLPTLARQLTPSAPLVGLVSAMGSSCWMLPQLVAANYLTGKARDKPYMIVPASAGRLFTLVFALVLFLRLGLHPLLLYWMLILWVAVFWLCDGLASVPWLHLVSKTIPPQRRGRLFGSAQALGGMLGVGVGLIVRHLLGQHGPRFPTNYAWLFVLGGTAYLASLGSILMLREDPRPASGGRLAWRAYLPRLSTLLGANADFRLVTLVRLLLGAEGMAAPFYILYGTEVLGLSQASTGFFVSVQVGASVLLGVLMGYLHERAGAKRVIELATLMGLMAPLGALTIPRLMRAEGSGFLWTYGLIFVGLQGVMSSMMPGFMNFVMEIAPRGEGPTYIGLANTLSAILFIYPVLGGVLLQEVSYLGLFFTTALAVAAALLLATRLREPQPALGTDLTPAEKRWVAEG